MVREICIERFEEFPKHVTVRPAWASDKRMPARYVRERTCTNVVTNEWGAKEANHFKCSECGARVADYECYQVCVSTDKGDVPWSYCPNCGAKVVS